MKIGLRAFEVQWTAWTGWPRCATVDYKRLASRAEAGAMVAKASKAKEGAVAAQGSKAEEGGSGCAGAHRNRERVADARLADGSGVQSGQDGLHDARDPLERLRTHAATLRLLRRSGTRLRLLLSGGLGPRRGPSPGYPAPRGRGTLGHGRLRGHGEQLHAGQRGLLDHGQNHREQQPHHAGDLGGARSLRRCGIGSTLFGSRGVLCRCGRAGGRCRLGGARGRRDSSGGLNSGSW